MYSITHKWKSLTQSTILAASITSRTTLSPTFYYHSFVLITSKKRGRVNYSYLVSNWYFPFQVLILIIIIRIYKDEYILFMLSLQKIGLFQCLQNRWNSPKNTKICSKCLSRYFFFSVSNCRAMTIGIVWANFALCSNCGQGRARLNIQSEGKRVSEDVQPRNEQNCHPRRGGAWWWGIGPCPRTRSPRDFCPRYLVNSLITQNNAWDEPYNKIKGEISNKG